MKCRDDNRCFPPGILHGVGGLHEKMPGRAIAVENSVGCAQEMIQATLTGGEATCGCCGEEEGCTGGACCSVWKWRISWAIFFQGNE
ncbi:MAG: hypothetical protein APR53_09265 [Methanoculleus sp. SDB]|nr:MAG: hypothetical protein APR53_09265 [Methanoculleus sp. SDB]